MDNPIILSVSSIFLRALISQFLECTQSNFQFFILTTDCSGQSMKYCIVYSGQSSTKNGIFELFLLCVLDLISSLG